MFKMAAAAMLNSGYQAFIVIIDVLFIEVVTFLPKLVKIGRKLRERHQFFKIQDRGSRHVDFWLRGALRCNGCVDYRSLYIPTNLVKTGRKLSERHRFFKIQDRGSRHVEFRLPDLYRYCRGVVYRSRYIPTKVGENRSKIERKASVFQNSRSRQPPC